jgi:transcription elongation factor Elf1|tara:strand:- start:128 stop:394 length:267 start_codon:yes stop_codon:yes gene_type:complete
MIIQLYKHNKIEEKIMPKIKNIMKEDEKLVFEEQFNPNFCEHKKDSIETGELYYGLGEHQYTQYFFCGNCGIEIDWEPDEDLMRGEDR